MVIFNPGNFSCLFLYLIDSIWVKNEALESIYINSFLGMCMKISIQVTNFFKKNWMRVIQELHPFFNKQRFFSFQPQCCLPFSWIELIGLRLFMSYLYDLFFMSSFIFIVSNHIISFKQTYLLFLHFSEDLLFFDDSVDEESEIAKVQPQGIT